MKKIPNIFIKRYNLKQKHEFNKKDIICRIIVYIDNKDLKENLTLIKHELGKFEKISCFYKNIFGIKYQRYKKNFVFSGRFLYFKSNRVNFETFNKNTVTYNYAELD